MTFIPIFYNEVSLGLDTNTTAFEKRSILRIGANSVAWSSNVLPTFPVLVRDDI